MSYSEFKMQLSVPKESEIGFKITELQNEVSDSCGDLCRRNIVTQLFIHREFLLTT